MRQQAVRGDLLAPRFHDDARTWKHWAWMVANALQAAFTVLWTGGLGLIVMPMHAITGNRQWALGMASRWWAPGLLAGAGVQLRVEGLENVDWSRNHVLVANHQSIIDICALFRAVPAPLHFLLKQEMTRMPLVGRYARAMGMIFIERGKRHAAASFLHDATRLVRAGDNLCIFPEGTRSRNGVVGAFKGGAFQVAMDAGVDVVPVAVSGSGAVLPSDTLFRVRPGVIRVSFGIPLATEGLVGARDRQRLVVRAHAAVIGMLAAQSRVQRDDDSRIVEGG